MWRTAGSVHGEMEAAARLLGRRPRFTGTETEWSRWSLHARAHVDTVSPSVADHIDSVEANVDRANPLSSLSDVAAENVRKMFHALRMLLHGRPLPLFKKVEQGNGFEARRLQVERDRVNASQADARLAGAPSRERSKLKKTPEQETWTNKNGVVRWGQRGKRSARIAAVRQQVQATMHQCSRMNRPQQYPHTKACKLNRIRCCCHDTSRQ